jgi:hypothetical protein
MIRYHKLGYHGRDKDKTHHGTNCRNHTCGTFKRGQLAQNLCAQIVEIVHEADTVSKGLDGFISIARHPSKIIWVGGTARDLANITNVKIANKKGEVLIDGGLNTFYGVPRDTARGVEFYVLRPDLC